MPRLFGPPGEPVDHCVGQDAKLNGPLAVFTKQFKKAFDFKGQFSIYFWGKNRPRRVMCLFLV